MSYSRWTNSRWYSYWSIPRGDAVENRDNARLEVIDAAGPLDQDLWFAAAEIREDVHACLRRVRLPTTSAELEELKGYMLEFVSDVDARYS